MIDQFGRDITYLRLSVTDKCNLRCRYCMPEEGVCKKDHADMLTEDEMITAVEAAAALGITKVRVVANKVRNADDEAFLKARIPEDALLGFIHYDADVFDADRRGMSPYDLSARTVDEIRAIKARIDSEKEA